MEKGPLSRIDRPGSGLITPGSFVGRSGATAAPMVRAPQTPTAAAMKCRIGGSGLISLRQDLRLQLLELGVGHNAGLAQLLEPFQPAHGIESRHSPDGRAG